VEVEPIDDETRERLDSGGVEVKAVASGPGKDAGIRVGDILTMIDNTKIESIDDFEKAMDSVESGATIAVLVQREQGPIFIALTVE
jgi:serine protease Do